MLHNVKLTKSYVAAFLLIVAIVSIEYMFGVCNNPIVTELYAFQVMILWLYFVIKSLNKNGVFSIYTLLLVTIFLFLYSGFFIDLILGSVEYKTINSLVEYTYPETTLQITFIYHSLFLATIDFIYLTTLQSYMIKTDKILTYDTRMSKIATSILWIFLIFALYRAFLEVKALTGNRLLLFREGGVDLPLGVRLGSNCFKVGYLMLLASVPSKGTFNKYSLLYFFTIIPNILIGNRMLLSVFVLFIFWYNSRFYNKKYNLGKIFIGAIIAILILQIIAFKRLSYNPTDIGIIDIFLIFVKSQSISFNILPLLIDYLHLIDFPYPAFLDSAISGFISDTGQSEEMLNNRADLGHQLVYTINPDYYLSGSSIGTSYIAEIAQFGIFGVFIGAILLAWFMGLFERLIYTNRFFKYFMFLFFTNLVTCPRASLFPSGYLIIRDILFGVIMYYIMNIILIRKKIS